jgi:hypothetical protein
MAQQLGGFSNVVPIRSIRSTQATTDTDTEPESQPAPSIRQAANDDANAQSKKVSGSDIREHGGGIGPRKHWQSLMQEGAMKQALDDYQNSSDKDFFNKYKMSKRDFYNEVINAGKNKKPYKAPQACPQCGKAHESCVCESIAQKIVMPGNTIPRKSVIQGYTVFYNPKTKTISITHGGDSDEAAIEQARLGTTSLKNFRMVVDKLIDRIDSELNEDNSGASAEQAILRRIMVAHTDLLMKYGPDKVLQAVEEVAYNVGDLDEIGTSDVSGWIHQVKQILGAVA